MDSFLLRWFFPWTRFMDRWPLVRQGIDGVHPSLEEESQAILELALATLEFGSRKYCSF